MAQSRQASAESIIRQVTSKRSWIAARRWRWSITGAISDTTAIDGDVAWATNVELADHLALRTNHGTPVYASSAATYGDGAAGFDDDATPAALKPLRPLNLTIDQTPSTSASRTPWQHTGHTRRSGQDSSTFTDRTSTTREAWSLRSSTEVPAAAARLFRSNQSGLADGEQRTSSGSAMRWTLLWLLETPQVNACSTWAPARRGLSRSGACGVRCRRIARCRVHRHAGRFTVSINRSPRRRLGGAAAGCGAVHAAGGRRPRYAGLPDATRPLRMIRSDVPAVRPVIIQVGPLAIRYALAYTPVWVPGGACRATWCS